MNILLEARSSSFLGLKKKHGAYASNRATPGSRSTQHTHCASKPAAWSIRYISLEDWHSLCHSSHSSRRPGETPVIWGKLTQIWNILGFPMKSSTWIYICIHIYIYLYVWRISISMWVCWKIYHLATCDITSIIGEAPCIVRTLKKEAFRIETHDLWSPIRFPNLWQDLENFDKKNHPKTWKIRV